MRTRKKIGIGIVAVFVILFVYGTIWFNDYFYYMEIGNAYHALMTECYEKTPKHTHEREICEFRAGEKHIEMYGDEAFTFRNYSTWIYG